MYGSGISREGEIIDLGVVAGVVDKAGAWFSYSGERIGQGKDNVREYLRERPAMAIDIENKVREKLGVSLRVGGATADAPAAGAPTKASKASKAAVAENPAMDDEG